MNQRDDDGDGVTDCADGDCYGTPSCPAPVENDDDLCSNGFDDDGDGLVDCTGYSCKRHPLVSVCDEMSRSDGPFTCADGSTTTAMASSTAPIRAAATAPTTPS